MQRYLKCSHDNFWQSPAERAEEHVLRVRANWPSVSSQEATTTSIAVAEVLAGKRVLGRSIRSIAELAELIREGLPATSLSSLGEKLELKNAALSDKLGIPQRTLTRRLSQHLRPTVAESDRAVRLARVNATAVEMIGNADKAAKWLRTPNRALGGEVPIDRLDTDSGAKEVENILGAPSGSDFRSNS